MLNWQREFVRSSIYYEPYCSENNFRFIVINCAEKHNYLKKKKNWGLLSHNSDLIFIMNLHLAILCFFPSMKYIKKILNFCQNSDVYSCNFEFIHNSNFFCNSKKIARKKVRIVRRKLKLSEINSPLFFFNFFSFSVLSLYSHFSQHCEKKHLNCEMKLAKTSFHMTPTSPPHLVIPVLWLICPFWNFYI